jgi:NADPH-dependent glutamate synthase beta subunit-like oxidoreductase/NAD-dependent dihydropyrimidine dehydrogenase PreA subunit
MTKDEKIAKLGKTITDRATVLLGKDKITPDAPEYLGINSALKFTAVKYDQKMADDILDIALTMKKRVPLTFEQLAEKNPQFDKEYLEKALQALSESGLVEYHWENLDGKNPEHKKRWVLDMFVPGSAEIMMINPEQGDMFPETADFFERMAYLPLAGLTELVPPGGAGIGMHVIPVEKAIPAESQSIPIEHLSHWLKKYEGHIGVSVCSCRKQQRIRGEGSGDIEADWCIGVGDFADYCRETNHGRDITYEEAMEILQKAEDRGYVHQITNIDGENKIFGICNCAVGVCNALRTSQLFNTPNLSASAYIAESDGDKCVACGKCVETCPAGAVRLGQKLCTKDGSIQYPRHEVPSDTKWGEEHWNKNYRNDNGCIQTWPTGTAPCKAACPAHIAIQGYIKMAGDGRYQDALKLIKKDNPFPAVCGSICRKYCEDACTRGTVDKALSIDEIKKFIAEQDMKSEHRYIPPMNSCTRAKFDQKVAIIGAGPAGMSCAYFLAIEGYSPVVFDKEPAPGGMLVNGIPNFRVDKKVVNSEIDVLKEMGVEFRCGVEVGKDITIQQLRDEGFKAFYVAVGLQKAQKLNIEGEELEGVVGGLDLLRGVNKGTITELSGDTVVIGGGNAAIDVARTALRLGKGSVNMYCLEKDEEMPTVPEEKNSGIADGVVINNSWAPKRILGENGKVTGIELMRCVSVRDANGKFAPVYDESETKTVECSNVLVAIGQRSDYGAVLAGTAAETADGRIIEHDKVTFQSAEPDIFVGGDCATGPMYTIDAIASGREGAVSIHRFVNAGQTLTIHRNLRQFKELDKSNVVLPTESFKKPARNEPAIDKTKSLTMCDDRITFTEEQIKAEASRCLSCGRSVVDPNKCIGCGICTTKCEFDAIHLKRVRPEYSKMIPAEDKFKAIGAYAAKRQVQIIKKNLSKK